MVNKIMNLDKKDLDRVKAISEETGIPENAILKWLIHQKYFQLIEEIETKEVTDLREVK